MVNLKAIWNSFQLKMVLKNAWRTLQFFQPFSLSSSRFFIAIFSHNIIMKKLMKGFCLILDLSFKQIQNQTKLDEIEFYDF